jgi:uncharacterized phage infection (PIP) family protein YhgE
VDRLQGGLDQLRSLTLANAQGTYTLEGMMSVTQAQIDAYAARVGEYASGVSAATDGLATDHAAMLAEIQTLKDRLAAGETVDLTGLDAVMARMGGSVDRLKALDATYPPPAPEPAP